MRPTRKRGLVGGVDGEPLGALCWSVRPSGTGYRVTSASVKVSIPEEFVVRWGPRP